MTQLNSSRSSANDDRRLKIAIAIATAGRRELMTKTVELLAMQSRLADELLICPAKDDDFDPECLRAYPGASRIFRGPVGSSPQRNILLESTNADVIVFFDDDFFPCKDYLEEIEMLFSSAPEVVVATGKLIADGIIGPGFNYQQGMQLLKEAGANVDGRVLSPVYNGYGCNMAVRMKTVRDHGVRFDERLPLYAWLEDVDFSRQLSEHGTIALASQLRGVHLGTKRSGRSPGRRLGYSQVANPFYLAKKGTMQWGRAFHQVIRNLMANSAYSFRPEPWVDRRGRLSGNLLALKDLLIGRLMPEQASNM